MIKKPNNWEETKAATIGGKREKLPAGGYEAKIISAKVLTNSNGSETLAVQVDITNGEYAGFFKRDFDNNPFEDRKWRGTARFFVPTDDGSEKDEMTKRYFKAMVEAVEKSNSGYNWSWDEASLKGLKVGIFVRDKEFDCHGHHGFFSDIFEFVDIQIINDGKFSIPEPKYLNGKSPTVPVSGEDAPAPRDEDAPPESADDTYPF